MWGSWYLPRFQFKTGSLTLRNIASFMVLVKHCGSLPTMKKLFNVMPCPVVWKWSKMGEGALRCSLSILPKCLPVSPMYSSVHPGWSDLYLYITPSFCIMLSLSLGAKKNSLIVLASLKWNCIPVLPHMFLTLSLRPLEYETTKICYGFVSVLMEVCVSVSFFLTELEIQFGSEPVENTVRVMASAECSLDLFIFLLQ